MKKCFKTVIQFEILSFEENGLEIEDSDDFFKFIKASCGVYISNHLNFQDNCSLHLLGVDNSIISKNEFILACYNHGTDSEYFFHVDEVNEQGVEMSKEEKSIYQEGLKKKVKKWMIDNSEDFIEDPTGLAETAAHEVYCDHWLDDPDHWIWDLSLEVLESEIEV